MESLKIVVTCGPAAAPVDAVRRLTNSSTGRLGVTLAEALAKAGHEVTCLKGEGATFPGPRRAGAVKTFLTNDQLEADLRARAAAGRVDVVFHAAALCDFDVVRVLDSAGRVMRSRKFSSRVGSMQLVLRPAKKLLPRLRRWFPSARIVGWKYEMEGSRENALAKARAQIRAIRSAGCVANGAAFGQGFAFCGADGAIEDLPDLRALVKFLVRWSEAGAVR